MGILGKAAVGIGGFVLGYAAVMTVYLTKEVIKTVKEEEAKQTKQEEK